MLHKSGLRVKYKPYQLYANDLQRLLPLVQLFSDLYITTLLSASGRLHLIWNSLLEAYGLCVWPVSMKLTCNAQTYASNMQTVPSQVKSTVRACVRACVHVLSMEVTKIRPTFSLNFPPRSMYMTVICKLIHVVELIDSYFLADVCAWWFSW